jgi:hypothetical protein
LQRAASNSAVARLIGNGNPLGLATRSFREERFQYDFSTVRVHAGAWAAQSAKAVGALAYTAGRDVVFESGAYAPKTPDGQRLPAHELAHVVQQSRGGATPDPWDTTSSILDAERASREVLQPGGLIHVSATTGPVLRGPAKKKRPNPPRLPSPQFRRRPTRSKRCWSLRPEKKSRNTRLICKQPTCGNCANCKIRPCKEMQLYKGAQSMNIWQVATRC